MTHEEEKEKEEEEIDLMMDKLQEDAVEAIEEKREDMQKLYNILGAKKFQFDLKKAVHSQQQPCRLSCFKFVERPPNYN